ncbi:sensor domain-containing diguanylate cyclase [Psychrobacillus soli]|uniref:Diguanylate cyclase n=1 Tax=Psychrobacillus soli TaxID=1543965 RepID=A0A544TM60_9BACI|nr:diguanylate cyclase [Psychrobacillus soli]TQR18547.1 diguanylate cyclase [Psychrobacillus soli]
MSQLNHYFQEAFQQSIKTGPIIFMHWFWDENMNPIDFVSPNVEAVFGYSVEELTSGKTRLIDVFVEEHQAIFISNVKTHIENKDTFWYESYEIHSKDKQIKYIRTYSYIQEEDILSNMRSVYTYVIDETALFQQLNEKELLATRYQVAIENAEEGVWEWDTELNHVFYSDDWKKMLGYESNEISNTFKEWEQLMHEDDLQNAKTTLEQYIAGQLEKYESEFRMLHKDGTYRWILSRGKIIFIQDKHLKKVMIGTHVDITEQKNTAALLLKRNEELEVLLKQIKELSITDPLTSLYNRRKILEELEEAQQTVKYTKESYSIAIIDLDFFKRINDTYGHSVGDETLKMFAAFIQINVRGQDIVGRWGGEEFFIIFPETTDVQAYDVLERLQKNFAKNPMLIKNHSITITFSAGIAGSGVDTSVDEMIKQADRALYEAKELGRNLIVKYAKKQS